LAFYFTFSFISVLIRKGGNKEGRVRLFVCLFVDFSRILNDDPPMVFTGRESTRTFALIRASLYTC
jgi:hypothetical protein